MYVRAEPSCQSLKNFHVNFKAWVSQTYPEQIVDETWQEVMAFDEAHPYSTHTLTAAPPTALAAPVAQLPDAWDAHLAGSGSGSSPQRDDMPSPLDFNGPEYIFDTTSTGI